MKNSITSFFIISFLLFHQTGYSQKAEKFDVEGITVIMKPTVKDIVNVSIYFRGGVTNYDAGKAGMGNLALAATPECGTKSYTRDTYKDKADKFGIIVSGSGSYDYGRITMNCISKYFNEGWDLLSSAVKNPSFNEKDFDLLKQKLLTQIKEMDSDPDSKIENMAIENTFKGTPYATDPLGKANTLESITAMEAMDYYYNSVLNKNKLFIVVVGKISKEEITARIRKTFKDLPSKAVTKYNYKVPVIESAGTVNIVPRNLATNYIIGVMSAPQFTSDEYTANRLAISAFSDNLFTEIRTNRNLSYAPYAVSRILQIPFNYMYVSTTDPKASVEVMVNEINRLKREGFSQKEFNDIKNLFITMNYMKEESTDRMASTLGTSEILGNWKMDDEFIENIQKTTPADMTRVFKKYIRGIHWNYLGDEKAADSAKAAFNRKVQ